MSKIVALDLGDQWIGIALSDSVHMLAMPYTTIKNKDLPTFLSCLLDEHTITKLILGYPLTMRGTHSQQTDKVVACKQALEQSFPQIKIVLWDERLTSQQALQIKPAKNKLEKMKVHARAAALILESYITAALEFGRKD